MLLLQLLINGMIAGSIYALVASGFSLIHSTNRFLHLAHGAVITLGAFTFHTLFLLLDLPLYISALATIVATSFLGWLTYAFIYSPLKTRGASRSTLLVASLALAILLGNILLLLFGPDPRSINFDLPGVNISGALITGLQLLIIIISLIILIILFAFTKWSKLGKTMRAVADNHELAEISGINSKKIEITGFIIGSAIAGLAAVLITLDQNIDPYMGRELMIKGLTGAIVGGVTSLPGAVFGSYFLGLLENVGILWLPSSYKDAIAAVLLISFLLFKPTGFFGLNKKTIND
jgi:branched-chain amino acid transport system permease protein